MKRLIWKCELCGDVVTSYSNLRWDMNYCRCGESAVDFEEYYSRFMGKVKEIDTSEKIDGKWISLNTSKKKEESSSE